MRDRIPSDSARWLAVQVRSMGFPSGEILAGTGLDEAWLTDAEALVTHAQYLAIVANALRLTGNPALGLSLGAKQNLGELGFLGYAIISSPTLREANEAAMKFWELNGSLVKLTYHEGSELGTWEIRPAFPIAAREVWIYAVEELLSAFHTAASFLSNQGFRYEEIRLSYPSPPTDTSTASCSPARWPSGPGRTCSWWRPPIPTGPPSRATPGWRSSAGSSASFSRPDSGEATSLSAPSGRSWFPPWASSPTSPRWRTDSP